MENKQGTTSFGSSSGERALGETLMFGSFAIASIVVAISTVVIGRLW